jgi:hypothetical protein
LKDAIGSAFDVNRIELFGQAMSDAFGNAGAALGGLVDAFSLYAQQQRDNESAREVANTLYKTDANKLAAAQSAITMKQQREQLGYYGNVAGAAKGFFKQNTTGYKLLEGAEKEFRLMQLAFQMESLYTHLFVTSAKTTATVTGQAVETGAVATGEAARRRSSCDCSCDGRRV